MRNQALSLTLVAAMATGAACSTDSTTEKLIEAEQAKSEEATAPEGVSPGPAETQALAKKTEKSDEAKANVAPGEQPGIQVENVGYCRTTPELSAAAIEAYSVADTNKDGRITREEAIGALNFVVGGTFLRLDANADGKITKAERTAVKNQFADDHPVVMTVLRNLSDSQAAKDLVRALDVDTTDDLSLAQARAATDATVDELFAAVDENSDDAITRQEAERGVVKATGALAKVAFNRWDADDSGGLTKEEFTAGFAGPLSRAFAMADKNGNEELSAAEATDALSAVGTRLETWAEPAAKSISNVVTVSN